MNTGDKHPYSTKQPTLSVLPLERSPFIIITTIPPSIHSTMMMPPLSSSTTITPKIRLLGPWLLLLLCLHAGYGGQVPYNFPDVPISSSDRVYLADQSSNSVSVIDPSGEKLQGLIRLGMPVLSSIKAVYRGQMLVHGMGYSPDSKTLAVVCVSSNAVVLIDTATNHVKNVSYVGRAPHEAMWTPDGQELWVTVRGQDYIQVLDGTTYEDIGRITVPDGPGMVVFSMDGKYAYICSSFTPQTVVVDTASREIVQTIPQESAFCPNIAASPDGKQVWFTLKDIGKTQVISALPPFDTLYTLTTGPITNHVNFVSNDQGQFAYVTVGGLNAVKVYTTDEEEPVLVATIPVGDFPHGLWPSGDGSRMYVGLENGNGLVVIDARQHVVLTTLPIGGQSPMAMLYVPNAVPDGTAANTTMTLSLPTDDDASLHIHLASTTTGQNVSSAVVNKQGLLDLLSVAVTGLEPGQPYVLALSSNDNDKDGEMVSSQVIADFKGGQDGGASVVSVGAFREALFGGQGREATSHLLIAPANGRAIGGAAVQVQTPIIGYASRRTYLRRRQGEGR